MTNQQIAAFNTLYEKACDKMKGLIILDHYRPKRPGLFDRMRAKKAISYFHQALDIYPEHFQSLFLIGKIYQRLENYEKALSYIEAAMRLDGENHNLPQEASLVAMHLDQWDKAIDYSREALRRKPMMQRF